MTLSLASALRPLVGAVEPGGGWLYELLTKLGVSPETARTVVDLIVRPVSILLVALVALIAARLGSRMIRRFLERLAQKAGGRSGARTEARVTTMAGLAANIWRFFVLVIAIAIVLGMLGINLTPLLASATIIGATLGFGAQQIVRDYISGFLLTVEDQYSVGDSITVDAVSGVVEDVTLRLTRIRASDGSIFFVPNGDVRLVGNTSRGWAHAVVDLTLPGAVATDLDGVRAVIAGAAHRVAHLPAFAQHCTVPPQAVQLMGADATTLILRVMLNTVPSQRDSLTRALREAALSDLAAAALWPGDPDPDAVQSGAPPER
jgi:moderate conductance mechanosensitive channel